MSRFNPHFPNAEAVFDAASKFQQRCLLEQRSLLADASDLWTADNFEPLIARYVERPDIGTGNFYEKLWGQLQGAEASEAALMAELFWIVQLPTTNLAPDYKRERIRYIWELKAQRFPNGSPFLTDDVLSGLGSGGAGYNHYLWLEVAFAVNAFANFIQRPIVERREILGDGWRFAEWLDSIPSGKGRQFYHTLCHVLFPDQFERVFSQTQKNKVARAQNIWTPAYRSSRSSLDRALLEVRSRLEEEFGPIVDYYIPPVGTLIPSLQTAKQSPVLPFNDDAALEPETGDEALSDGTAGVRTVENLILFGPPGTSKTFELERRRALVFKEGGESTFVTFHPNYAYEDFLGGLRPFAAPNGQGIVVKFVKGPFLELCEKAHQNPTLPYVLFIDEINRANLAKVFGELITLIEPSKRVMAGSSPSETGAWLTIPGLDADFAVPDNLSIVATMNTADRSIAMMDIAMRRRFTWVECGPNADRIQPRMVGRIDLRLLLQKLNDRLEYLLDRDHRIGHALFMGLDSMPALVSVLSTRVIPLLQEYFFDDLDRVRLALTGGINESPFFKTQELRPSELFTGGPVGTTPRKTFALGDPKTWTENDIIALYDQAGPGDDR